MSVSGPVLVTGASGFVGRQLCERLLALGVEVHGVSRESRPGSEIAWHRLDLSDLNEQRALFARVSPDTVFHLAGEVTGARTLADVLATFRSNLASTVGLLVTAAESGCRRVVLAGSMEELGGAAGITGSGYAAAKLSATTYARMLHGMSSLSVVNLRLFMVYGPGDGEESRVVPYTIKSFLNGVSPLLSSGSRPVDWVYVADVVDAFIAGAAASTGDDGAPIDIGSGELVTIREIADLIAHETGSDLDPTFGGAPDRDHEAVTAANPESARTHLGWSPTTPLSEGIAQTVAWYADRG